MARTPCGVELSAVWPEPIPAAVLSRAGVLWAVSDAGAVAEDRIDVAPPDAGLQAVIGAPELDRQPKAWWCCAGG